MNYTVTQPTPDPADDSVEAPHWLRLHASFLDAHEFIRTHPEFNLAEFARGIGLSRPHRAPEVLASLEHRRFIRRTYSPPEAGVIQLLPIPDAPDRVTKERIDLREVIARVDGTPSRSAVLDCLPPTKASFTSVRLYEHLLVADRYSARGTAETLGWEVKTVRIHYAELLAAGLIFEYERDYLLVFPPGHKDEVESMVEDWLTSGRPEPDERWVQGGRAMPDYRRLVATHKAVARAANVTIQGYSYDNQIAKQLVQAIPRERLFSLVGWYVLSWNTGFGDEADRDIASYGPTLRLLQKHLAPIDAAYLREERIAKGKRFWGRSLDHVGLPVDFCDLEQPVG